MKRQGVSLNPEDTIPTVEAELLTRRLDISLMSDAACQTKPVKLGARLSRNIGFCAKLPKKRPVISWSYREPIRHLGASYLPITPSRLTIEGGLG